MGGISNEGYLSRNKRLEKVGQLLEEGVPKRDIANQLGVEYRVVDGDVQLLSILSRGSLSPEITAEKRIVIDNRFSELEKKVMETYETLITSGKFSTALNYMKTVIDINKFKATIWGLDADPASMANFNADSINFNKVDVTLDSNEFRKLRGIISRKDENLVQYDE